MAQCTFKRYEKKYLLTPAQYEAVRTGMESHMVPDAYSHYTICNVYYDTDDFSLIRTSLDKPVYKEKLRVRSYGVASDDSKAFVELKKKYEGVVYKRRVVMGAADAVAYLEGRVPEQETQIHREIDWFMKSYRPTPKAFIAYDREAYAGRDNPDLRITFDTNLRGRMERVDLRSGDDGQPILDGNQILMEIKIPGAAPLWLARLLSENQIFSTSFSKYGAYYKKYAFRDAAAQFAPAYRTVSESAPQYQPAYDAATQYQAAYESAPQYQKGVLSVA